MLSLLTWPLTHNKNVTGRSPSRQTSFILGLAVLYYRSLASNVTGKTGNAYLRYHTPVNASRLRVFQQRQERQKSEHSPLPTTPTTTIGM